MKKIAISQQLAFSKHNDLQEIIDSNWGGFSDELGVLPIYLPVRYDFEKLCFDGVILTGGGDIFDISQKPEDKTRDSFELSLIKFCIAKDVPIFGICRGMQIINYYFGGTLKKIENHAGCRHFLHNGREVNSYHNYAIDKLGKNLDILDTCGDVIESVQHSTHRIFAQMSHPERENPFSIEDLEFIGSCFNVG